MDAWCKQFQRCEWSCDDFRKVIGKAADRTKCGIYCDPPWVNAVYIHSFTKEDHIDLRDRLMRFADTQVLVRYGDDPFIRDLYQGWTITEKTSRSQANKDIPEIWITN